MPLFFCDKTAAVLLSYVNLTTALIVTQPNVKPTLFPLFHFMYFIGVYLQLLRHPSLNFGIHYF